MKKISLFILFVVMSSFTGDYLNLQQSGVYLCSHPSKKCYYSKPCPSFYRSCTDVDAKILKVSESRAKAMGKEKCDCDSN
tara:strand:+ start:50 stop:289 length:240 start_codon:yes stop_codon:yes gene_type:complete